jgi:Co/Zn/Cd efflux system component
MPTEIRSDDMAATCCDTDSTQSLNSPAWRRALWIALAVNGAMFIVEVGAGAAAGSRALQADALDFFGDSANYAISLAISGLALGWRARAAFVKGLTLLVFGAYVLGSAALAALGGASPEAEVMGIVGTVALAANVGVALLLFRFRRGDANMKSVWICSRNDAIGNIAVVAAAAGVLGTHSAWPDLIVAAVLAGLAIWGGVQIMSQASVELLDSSDGTG